MAIYQTYKGATLVLKMSTAVPESGTRVSLSGYEIQVKAQGYSATVEVVDQYNVKAIFAASTTEKFLVGNLPVVVYLTKDGKTAVGKAEGVVILDPSSRGISADAPDPINVSMDVSTIEATFDVALNGVFAYEDLTTEQREEIISGIQEEADLLFLEINQSISNANAATLAANAAAAAASNASATAIGAADSATEAAEEANEATMLSNQAEDMRKSNETNRISAESSRVSAESARVTAESARVTAESSRVTAENGRVTAENDRVQNDIYRGKYVRSAEYDKRVTTDSGTIRDRNLLNAMYDDALNLLPNTDLWYNLECGIKTRVSGLNTYVSKVYDLSTNNRDASQTTEASQPYLVSNINPANRLAIWGLNRLLPLSSSVAKITTDKWTLAVNVKPLGGLCEFIGSNNTRLSVTTAATDSVTFKNESGTSVSLNLLSKIVGTSARLYFVAKGDGTMQVWLNGVLQGTLSNPTNATFTNLYASGNGELKAIRLFNKDLNKSEIEFLDAKMAAYYSPFEGVTIGNQVWEASNAMDIVAPDGTAISEVQLNDAASATELITNAADREFTSDTGFWTKNASPVVIANGVLRVDNAASNGTGIRRSILVVGKKYKVTLTVNVVTGGNIRIGFGDLNDYIITTTGTFTIMGACKIDTFLRIYGSLAGMTYEIDDISLVECGWADSQTLYDNAIAFGKSVTEALNAASAWCYYNNSEANGAVYGRQYNNYAVVKLTGSPIWRAPMKADFDQLATFLNGAPVAGGKLKASGSTYWANPNSGATNESGFSGISGGLRGNDGVFFGRTANGCFITIDKGVYTLSFENADISSVAIGFVATRGYYLRRLRRVPSGDLVREITSGVFTTNITGGTFKDIAVPNMYRITGVKVTSAQALTNFTLEARTAAGVLVQNLLSGKSIGAGKSIIFSVVADMEVMLQDYIARATAVGNGGAGMEIELIIEKIKV